VLVFVDGGIPARDGGAGGGGGFGGGQPAPEGIPRSSALARPCDGGEDRARAEEVRRQRRTILTIGSSTALGYHFGLPIKDALVERVAGGVERPLPREKYYVPGSLLEARIDNTNPLAYGMEQRAIVFYDESPRSGCSPRRRSRE